MDVLSLEMKLSQHRASREWHEVYSILDPMLLELTGVASGWANMQLAYTIHVHTPDRSNQALAYIDTALPLVAEDKLLLLQTLLAGCPIAYVAADSKRYRAYAQQLEGLVSEGAKIPFHWRARAMATLAAYCEFKGRTETAVRYLKLVLKAYEAPDAPSGTPDRNSQVAMTLLILGEIMLGKGRRSQAERHFKMALVQLQSSSNKALISFLEGRSAQLSGRLGDAEAHFRAGIAHANETAQTMLAFRTGEALGEMLNSAGDFAGVSEVLQPIIRTAAKLRLVAFTDRLQIMCKQISGGYCRSWLSDWFSLLSLPPPLPL